MFSSDFASSRLRKTPVGNYDFLRHEMTRRRLLGAAGIGGLACYPHVLGPRKPSIWASQAVPVRGHHDCLSAERTDDLAADEPALARNSV
jgi:hypothetical protein